MPRGIPPELTPWVFRLSTASGRSVKTGLLVLFLVPVVSYLTVLRFVIGQAPTLSTTLKVIGFVGDGVALGVLVISTAVDRYSQSKYVSAYLKKAAAIPQYQKLSDKALRDMLEQFYGTFRNNMGTVLKSDVGALLIALGTILAFVGDFVKS